MNPRHILQQWYNKHCLVNSSSHMTLVFSHSPHESLNCHTNKPNERVCDNVGDIYYLLVSTSMNQDTDNN